MKTQNSGQALMIAMIFFMFVSLAIISALISPVVTEYSIANNSIKSKESFFLSESGLENAYYQYVVRGHPLGYYETINAGQSTATTESLFTGDDLTITAVGDSSSRIRNNKLILSSGVSASQQEIFSFSLIALGDEFHMSETSRVDGGVHSNGVIAGSGSNTIEFSSAGKAEAVSSGGGGSGTPTVSNDTPIPPTGSFQCGNDLSYPDLGQSFVATQGGDLLNLEIYVKKNAAGIYDMNIIILDGNPSGGGGTPIASGSITGASVGTNYGWVGVSNWTNNPSLVNGNTYWIVFDCNDSITGKYYELGNNTFVYNDGGSIQGIYISGAWLSTGLGEPDIYFKAYQGSTGGAGLISNLTIDSTVTAKADTISNSTVFGVGYLNTNDNSTINQAYPLDPLPSPLPVPTPYSNIGYWELLAEGGGTEACTGGVYTVDTAISLGPKKIPCDLEIVSGGILHVTGPLWVVGNITVFDGGRIRGNISSPDKDQIIIAHDANDLENKGKVTLQTAEGYGEANSTILIVAMNSPSAHIANNFINTNNVFGSLVLFAPESSINIYDNINVNIEGLVGYNVYTGDASTILHSNSPLILDIATGPGAGWTLQSWQEVVN